jgi:hypothetical protein
LTYSRILRHVWFERPLGQHFEVNEQAYMRVAALEDWKDEVA